MSSVSEMLRIDVGCGERPYEDGNEWVHVDMRQLDGVDCVCDVKDLAKHFRYGSAYEIRATHILEHFPYRDTVDVLNSWRRILSPGGRLYLEVPNLTGQVDAFVSGEDHEEVVRLMFGEQDHHGNFHYAAFTEDLLEKRLAQAAFKRIHVHDIGMVLCAEGYA